MDDPQVFWDYQVGTFTGIYNGLKVGLSAGEIVTVAALESALGVTLSAEIGARLQAEYLQAPYVGARIYVKKPDIFKLFSLANLRAIYGAAETSVDVRIFLSQFDNGPYDVEITGDDFITGVTQFTIYGLISPPEELDRILKGIPWRP